MLSHLQDTRLAAQLEVERRQRVRAKLRYEAALAQRNADRAAAGIPRLKTLPKCGN